MSKPFLLGLIIGILLLGGSVAATRLSRAPQDSMTTVDPSDATPIEVGVMTDRQRMHSRLFQGYAARYGNRRIPETANSIPGNEMEMGQFPALVPIDPDATPVTISPDSFISQLAQQSDLVIRGLPVSKASQLTDNQAFIFTDYDVQIIQVVRNTASSSAPAPSHITVTWPGGKILLNGKVIKAVDRDFGLLTNGEPFILFLKAVPETGAYSLVNKDACFAIRNGAYFPLTEAPSEILSADPVGLQTAIEGLVGN